MTFLEGTSQSEIDLFFGSESPPINNALPEEVLLNTMLQDWNDTAMVEFQKDKGQDTPFTNKAELQVDDEQRKFLVECKWLVEEPQIAPEVVNNTSPESIAEMTEIAHKLQALRKEKADHEEASKELTVEIDTYSQILNSAITRNGLKNLSVVGIGTISPTTSITPRVTDVDALKAFFTNQDLFNLDGKLMEMFKMTINAQTLKSWYSSYEMPEGFSHEAIGLATYEKKSVSIRKG
ncbi:MAG: hypothetical protein NTV01_01860 [Bacteroidia bacterium]|nr:hypothetical protein [Bacteroidia bacterium]